MNFKLIILSVLLILVAGCVTQSSNNITKEPTYPEATGYVVDTSGVLKEEIKKEITDMLQKLDNVAQIAVVTIPTTQPLEIEEYSIKLAEKWKPGYKGKDNGVIFIIVTGDRKVRIEVGRGLEGSLNDAKAGRILDESVIPFLKVNDWNGGILAGVNEIVREVNKNE